MFDDRKYNLKKLKFYTKLGSLTVLYFFFGAKGVLSERLPLILTKLEHFQWALVEHSTDTELISQGD